MRALFFKQSLAISFLCISISCSASRTEAAPKEPSDSERFFLRVETALKTIPLPESLKQKLLQTVALHPADFSQSIEKALSGDPYLSLLVDKQHPLPSSYAPTDLVSLSDLRKQHPGLFRLNRADLNLRVEAADAFLQMARAAGSAGLSLLASSSYRSYTYQEGVYKRVVAQLGQEAADRESAPPGMSQHQLGLVLDFGSIDDSFAKTAESRWLAQNAGNFGWSLSFPQGYEQVTGYRWESWHYRYVGKDLVAFIDTYFEGIQQYALEFLDAWKRIGKENA
ncbi:hypothetical protein MASR2M78_30720 [Treponema sp.]